MAPREETLNDSTVLIAGGGPIGMLLASVLAYFSVKSVVLERNLTTTKWPKMDLTNARSMELLHKVGLADLVREHGVPSHFPYPVIISTGLNSSKPLSRWDLPSVDTYRKEIAVHNDGTQPQEPYQRISQSIFEAVLRSRCDANPLIDLRFGWKVNSVEETEDSVVAHVTNVMSGDSWVFTSRYLAACDGASSVVRQSLQIALDGGPTPSQVLLVHFKSRDLARLHQHAGQFWHIFLAAETGSIGGAVISQNEVDTWTAHMFLPLDQDGSDLSSEQVVAKVLGGVTGDYPVRIDEILVRSTYRPHIAVARNYSSPKRRIFLAGDSAHQNVPTGGYGMNMGIGDAFDLGWQLAAVIQEHGGKNMLLSYEQERRPVALLSVEQSGKHLSVHMGLAKLLDGNLGVVDNGTEKANMLRHKIDEYYQQNDWENKDIGVEMGYRYESPTIISDRTTPPPIFDPHRYTPSTWPGMRVPHVYLNDGGAIFDRFGRWYTLVEFSDGKEHGASLIMKELKKLGVPLEHLCLVGEDKAYVVWGARLVLVRPDHHVAWRGENVPSFKAAETIARTVSGYDVTASPGASEAAVPGQKPDRAFTSTAALNTQTGRFEFEGIGEMQR